MLALLIIIPISLITVVWYIKIVYITPGVMYRNCLYHSILVWSNVIVYITPGVMHRFCLYHSILVWSSGIVYITPSWSDASKLFISHHWYFMSLKKFRPWWDSNPWPLVLEARSILSELPGLHASTLNYHPYIFHQSGVMYQNCLYHTRCFGVMYWNCLYHAVGKLLPLLYHLFRPRPFVLVWIKQLFISHLVWFKRLYHTKGAWLRWSAINAP